MKIAFNTANLVGRVTGYRFKGAEWGEQARKTVEATDEKEWAGICKDISAAGYTAVEIWTAHADPERMTADRAELWSRILEDHGLTPVAYASGPTEGAFEVCCMLGIPCIVGGFWGNDLESASMLCAKYEVSFYYENHPEKSAAEILASIAGADPKWVGAGVDLGWLGIHGTDAPATLRELGPDVVRHIHVKDVVGVGNHGTVPIGEGAVNVAECLKVLAEMKFDGVYSWEDEPEDRNPLDVAVRCREWLEARIGR